MATTPPPIPLPFLASPITSTGSLWNPLAVLSSTTSPPRPPAPSVRFPAAPKVDVQRAVAAAKAAYPSWSQTSFEVRAAFLDKVADALQLHFDRLAQMESEDAGKPLWGGPSD